MSTLIRHLNFLSPEDFDIYLQKGWRSTGQAVYNCNFLRIESGEMVSVLPLRLSLEGYQFGKSIRKLLRRNLKRYRVEYGPALQMDQATYAVNQAYLNIQPNKSLDDLNYHITGNYNRRVLNTWEVRVYDNDRLVAFSYFDLGAKTAYGKAGIYHPDYAPHSLGLFTMALEIEFCIRRGLVAYYPGYVSDETTLFNYKHRIGQMEFFDVFSQSWLIYGKYPELQQPLKIVKSKLEEAAQLLDRSKGLEGDMYIYPHIDARYSSFGQSEYLDAPMFLLLKQTTETRYHILVYQPSDSSYAVLKVRESQYGMMVKGNSGNQSMRSFAYALIIELVLLADEPTSEGIINRYLSSYCI